MSRRSISLMLGLAVLMVLATVAPLPAVETTGGAGSARSRLSGASHDPVNVQLSPDDEWVTYRAAVRVSDGERRRVSDLADGSDYIYEFTYDGTGILVLRPGWADHELRRGKLASGSLETLGESVIYARLFSSTFDGMSVAFFTDDNTLSWWDEDGSVTPLVSAGARPTGLAAAPDRDVVHFAEFESITEPIEIRGVTSTGTVTDYGTIAGEPGFSPGVLGSVTFTFLPDQDRAIISVTLQDGIRRAWVSHILNLNTGRISYAAPAANPQVSPDGSLAFFEVTDDGKVYGRIVPTEHPGQSFNLPDKSAKGWFVHPDWTHVAEVQGDISIYTMDGTIVSTVNMDGVLYDAAFVDNYFVSSQLSSDAPLYSDPIGGGATTRLSAARTSVKVIGGFDGYVYWVEYRNEGRSIWRAEPDGRNRAQLTPKYSEYDYWNEFSLSTGKLIYVADEALWAIDLAALPRHACVDRVATHIGTNKKDVIDGTAGNDVIVTLGGNDIIRGGDGRDRICSGNGDDRVIGEGDDDWLRGGSGDDQLDGKSGDDNINDRLGINDVDGGPGSADLCKATGVIVNCEKP